MKNTSFIHAGGDRCFGLRGDGDHPPERIVDPRFPQPLERGAHVRHGLGGGEGLRGDHDQCLGGIEHVNGFVECLPVDIGQVSDLEPRVVAAERVDQQGRAEHRTADPDVKNAGDLSERTTFDCVDQGASSRPANRGKLYRVWRAVAAFSHMFRRPSLR